MRIFMKIDENKNEKTGNPMRIQEELGYRKAYDALTDPVAKRNYRIYGNPDGPVRVELSVALPSVDKELGRGS